MKTHKKTLYKSQSIIDLNASQMQNVKGGSTTFFVDWVQDQIDEAKEQMSPWI